MTMAMAMTMAIAMAARVFRFAGRALHLLCAQPPPPPLSTFSRSNADSGARFTMALVGQVQYNRTYTYIHTFMHSFITLTIPK